MIIVVTYPDHGAGNDPTLFLRVGAGGVGRDGGDGGLGVGIVFTTKAQYFYNGQYGSNDLPQPRRSALLECF